jgi:carboxyl-terminal processing protease
MKSVFKLLVFLACTLGTASAAEFNRQQAGTVAQVVGRLLEHAHYKQARLDDDISKTFLKHFLDALDYNHLVFLQADVDELEKRFGTTLDDLTLAGNAAPAFEIFDRYLRRLNERRQLVQKLLQQKFDFTRDETFLLSRNKAPWPKDKTEAEALWRLRIKYELLQGRLANEKPEEILKTIEKRYDRSLQSMLRFGSEEILQTYLTALARSFDPHSEYLSPTSAVDFEINNVKLSLIGIGAALREEDGYIKIERLIPGGPAELSKQLRPNDRIVAVGQGGGRPVDTVDMRLREVVEMIRGPRGTEVRLTIIPGDSLDGSSRRVVGLTRDEVQLTAQKARARIIETPDGMNTSRRLGVITLPQFYEKCARDVEKLLERLKEEKISGLVLDLRRNAGGILNEAVELTGLFINRGPVVQVKDNRNRIQVLEDTDSKVAYDGPLIVLAGHLSASASEIVAAALQDYGRALIVGDQATHGKGTVQTVLGLNQVTRLDSVPDPGKLKLTMSKFYRVTGSTTQRVGVAPDLILPSIYDYLDLGESSLENSLPADETNPLPYERLNRVKTYVAELQKKSVERVGRSAEFAYINEDIEFLKQRRADNNISLNEAKRLREKTEQDNRLQARKQERALRKPAHERVFEVSLEMAGQRQPLKFLAAGEQKEGDPLAAFDVRPASKEAAVETEPPGDVHLEETLSILNDYARLLGEAKNSFVSKNAPSSLP